jgi:hypothetical protein
MPAPPPGNPRTYDIFVRSGGSRLFLRNPNSGITLRDDGLTWINDGEANAETFSRIAAIHLQTGQVGRISTALDQCIVEFADGVRLIVTNASPSGLPDEAQTPSYREFVYDLHRRVAAAGCGNIRFSAGMAPWRYKVLTVALVVAALFFVLTPVVLALVTGDLKGLAIAGGGVFLGVPFVRMLMNNAPRDYTPDLLPDELLS